MPRVNASMRASRARPRAARRQTATIEIRELDPVRKCGPGTSVQFLYRVIERRPGELPVSHLVYFDRHGWYCEHGRSCAAVGLARTRKSKSRR